jgi:hypothetical protein
VLVGYGDDNYSFDNMLAIYCRGRNYPFLAGYCATAMNTRLSANRPDPGFSVLQLEKFTPGMYLGFPPPFIDRFKQGYRYKPHVEDVLNITNGLLDGTLKQPTAAPTLPPVAIPSMPTPSLPF